MIQHSSPYQGNYEEENKRAGIEYKLLNSEQ